MDEELIRTLDPHRLNQGLGLLLEVDQEDPLAGGDFAHGRRIVAVGVADVPLAVEVPAPGRGDEYRCRALAAGVVDELLEGVGVVVVGAAAWAFLLLVVMAELNYDVVAGLHLRQGFPEPPLAKEHARRKPRFGVVGDRHAVVEELREHLPPPGVRLGLVVDNGGVAAEENGRHFRSRLDLDVAYPRGRSVELEGQLAVPVDTPLFARFQLDPILVVDAVVALADDEGLAARLTLAGRGVLYHHAARLGPDGGAPGAFLAPEGDGHAVVAVGDGR